MTDARFITRTLRGHWYGRYGLAFCPAHHNTRTPALSLAEGADGRLLAHCFAGCSFAAIAQALRGLGILSDEPHTHAPDPIMIARRREADKADRAKRIGQARRIWAESQPIAGTMAERYLRGRAITSSLPDSLRFHPACWHGPTARRHPAMIAKVEHGDTLCGVMRTYLASDATKAAIDKPKMALGVCHGGAVVLSAGAGPLVVCEGIETGLSLTQGLQERCGAVWACLGTKGLQSVDLPIGCRDLVIAADGDEPGTEVANALARRAVALGVNVRMMQAPKGQDWNDVAREVAL